MTCLHYWISWSEHRGMTWLNYIIDTSWNKHRGTIHKIYKWIHSEVTNTSTLITRHWRVAECRWNLPGTREVCSRDLEEVRDDGLQGHDHTYGIETEAIEWWFITVGCCHDVSSDDWVFDVLENHETRYFLCCEHNELVPNGSKTCSLDCCKAYSKAPKGYSWLWAHVWGESKD